MVDCRKALMTNLSEVFLARHSFQAPMVRYYPEWDGIEGACHAALYSPHISFDVRYTPKGKINSIEAEITYFDPQRYLKDIRLKESIRKVRGCRVSGIHSHTDLRSGRYYPENHVHIACDPEETSLQSAIKGLAEIAEEW